MKHRRAARRRRPPGRRRAARVLGAALAGLILAGGPAAAGGVSAAARGAPSPSQPSGPPVQALFADRAASRSLTAPGGTAGSASPQPAATGPLVLSLEALSPTIPQPGQILRVTTTVRNRTGTPIHGLTAALVYSPLPFQARSDLDAFAHGHDGFGISVGGSYRALGNGLPPHGSQRITFAVPVANLQLPTGAVGSYPFGVQVSGTEADGASVGTTLHTYLPWWPIGVSGVAAPEPIGWLWPLVDRPHRTPGGRWLSGQLARELAPGGRLNTLLAAGVAAQSRPARAARPARRRHPAVLPTHPVGLTWAVDPMLVDDASGMVAGYRLRGRPGPGRAAARGWLAGLRAAVRHGSLLGLPYGDPDVVAADRAGLAGEVARAQRTGAQVLLRQLGVRPLPGYRWPPAGELTPAALRLLLADGGRRFVLSDATLPGRTQQYTHSARSSLVTATGRVPALVTDSILSGVVAAGSESAPDAALAVQQFAAETLFIDTEQPGLSRAVIVAPPRRWAPSAGYAARLLWVTAHAPWLRPMTLPAIAGAPWISTAARGPLSAHPPGPWLAAGYLHGLVGLRARLDTVEQILTLPAGRDALAQGLELGLLRCLSTAWRTDPAGGFNLRNAEAVAVSAVESGVQVTSRGQVTLTSHHGLVPITIENRLRQPVSVRLRLNAATGAARFSGGGTQRIAAGQTLTAQVAVTAQTSGIFPVEVQLLTPDGRPYGARVQLLIHSTAYGLVALGITGGAFIVLLLTVAVRLVRRVRRVRREPAPGGRAMLSPET